MKRSLYEETSNSAGRHEIYCMEREHSLSYSEESATWPSPEPDQPYPHPHTYFFNAFFNIITPISVSASHIVSSGLLLSQKSRITVVHQMGKTMKKSWCSKTKQYPSMSLRTEKTHINLRITSLEAQNRLQYLVNMKRERTANHTTATYHVKTRIAQYGTYLYWNNEGKGLLECRRRVPALPMNLIISSETMPPTKLHGVVYHSPFCEPQNHAWSTDTRWDRLRIPQRTEGSRTCRQLLLPLVTHSTIFAHFSLIQREVRK
jgi:hypothetical protein